MGRRRRVVRERRVRRRPRSASRVVRDLRDPGREGAREGADLVRSLVFGATRIGATRRGSSSQSVRRRTSPTARRVPGLGSELPATRCAPGHGTSRRSRTATTRREPPRRSRTRRRPVSGLPFEGAGYAGTTPRASAQPSCGPSGRSPRSGMTRMWRDTRVDRHCGGCPSHSSTTPRRAPRLRDRHPLLPALVRSSDRLRAPRRRPDTRHEAPVRQTSSRP